MNLVVPGVLIRRILCLVGMDDTLVSHTVPLLLSAASSNVVHRRAIVATSIVGAIPHFVIRFTGSDVVGSTEIYALLENLSRNVREVCCPPLVGPPSSIQLSINSLLG